MPKQLIAITFGIERTDSVHRIQNFAEDLQRDLLRNSGGVVEDTDSITNQVNVLVSAPRNLGDVLSTIRAALKKSNLIEEAVITKKPC